MLRSVTLGLALSVLAAACALVEPPIPAGTRAFQVEVQNDGGPVQLSVTTPSGTIPGAVQPASLPAGSRTNVTFYLPVTGEWTTVVNGRARDILGRLDVNQECQSLYLHLLAGRSVEVGSTC